MNSQLVLSDGSFWLRGALEHNNPGMVRFSGFVSGRPLFEVVPIAVNVTTSAASNVLTAQGHATQYNNANAGPTSYTLPPSSPDQWVGISNAGVASPLTITAPGGAKIRWTDGQLYASVVSPGAPDDNITLVGDSGQVWQVRYSGQGAWSAH